MSLRASRAAALIGLAIAGCATDDPGLASSVSEVDVNAFVLPRLSAAERMPIVHRYASLDPKADIPRGLLEDAIIYFDVNKAQIPKTSSFIVVDLSRYSGKDRFWIVDLASG